MEPCNVRYELTPEILTRLISVLNRKRAKVFHEVERQRQFLMMIEYIISEVEHTDGVYPDHKATALRQFQSQLRKLQLNFNGFSRDDKDGLSISFWNVSEHQRKNHPRTIWKKAKYPRFRAMGQNKLRFRIDKEELRETAPTEAEKFAIGDVSGWGHFHPDEMLSMLDEAVDDLIKRRALNPPNRHFQGKIPKSRALVRGLVLPFLRTFGELPGAAVEGVFGSIVNELLSAFGEPEVGQDALRTIISEQIPGFERMKGPKPL